MAKFDYEVVIIGSGFGGSVAALRPVSRKVAFGAPAPRLAEQA